MKSYVRKWKVILFCAKCDAMQYNTTQYNGMAIKGIKIQYNTMHNTLENYLTTNVKTGIK